MYGDHQLIHTSGAAPAQPTRRISLPPLPQRDPCPDTFAVAELRPALLPLRRALLLEVPALQPHGQRPSRIIAVGLDPLVREPEKRGHNRAVIRLRGATTRVRPPANAGCPIPPCGCGYHIPVRGAHPQPGHASLVPGERDRIRNYMLRTTLHGHGEKLVPRPHPPEEEAAVLVLA